MCNADGEYVFDLKNAKELFRYPEILTVWASNEAGDLGWHEGLRDFEQKPLSIQLKPTKVLTGRLVDETGSPIANAKLILDRLMELPFNQTNRKIADVPKEFRTKFATTTDAKGRFKLAGVPAAGSVWCDVESAGLPGLAVCLNGSQSINVILAAGPALTGKIVPPAGLNFPPTGELGKLTFSGWAQFNSAGDIVNDRSLSSYQVRTKYETKIDKSGSFHFDNIAPGTYWISGKLAKGVPVLLPEEIKVSVKPGESINDFEINAIQTFRISGRVVGAVDNEPVVDADVLISSEIAGSSRGPKQIRVKTDAKGEYAALVHPGTVTIRTEATPEGYLPNGSELRRIRMPRADISEDTQLPDLLVNPAQDVTIEVIDENGKPAVGAVVKIVTPSGTHGGNYQSVLKTDLNGKYVVKRVASNDTLPIRVYTPTAISDPTLVITPSEHDEPVANRTSVRTWCSIELSSC